MKTTEKLILAVALIVLSFATVDRVLDLVDPCFESHTDTCVEALIQENRNG